MATKKLIKKSPKKATKKAPARSRVTSQKSKWKTVWDLSPLYKNENDPQMESDLAETEAAYDRFVTEFKDADLTDETIFLQAVRAYEELLDLPGIKPYYYLHYRHDLASSDTAIEGRLNLVAARYTKNANKVLFFPIKISRLPDLVKKQFLASDTFRPYRYFLEGLFREAKHILSESEEKVISLLSLPAHDMWVRGSERLLSRETVLWKGKARPISEVVGLIPALPTADRRKLAALLVAKLRSISDSSENELNAIVTAKKIEDELRGYQKPHEATVLRYQNDLATVDTLVATVTKHFPIAHRFFKLKAKMLGQKTLAYADRGVSVGKTKKEISFDQAVDIVDRAFRAVSPEYADIFLDHLRGGQIDVFPRVGKTGGAYCSSHPHQPTYLLLNHLSDLRSVSTLGHEMGHALHAYYSHKNQPPLYRAHTIATAETASTFFENFVFDEVFTLLSEKEKIVALHDRINDSVQTIFRQVACFNFELEMHNRIRAEGNLSKVEIAKTMNKHMQSYLGPVFKLTEDDGYFFVYWSHIRRFFYVYSYAFGELVSSALYSLYQKDHAFDAKVRQFLSAGGSATPEDIFGAIGIDVRNPAFFEEGLKKVEGDIARLEKLVH